MQIFFAFFNMVNRCISHVIFSYENFFRIRIIIFINRVHGRSLFLFKYAIDSCIHTNVNKSLLSSVWKSNNTTVIYLSWISIVLFRLFSVCVIQCWTVIFLAPETSSILFLLLMTFLALANTSIVYCIATLFLLTYGDR